MGSGSLRIVLASFALAVAAVGLPGGCASAPKAVALAPPVRAVETFDEVWQAIADAETDAPRADVDWNALREEYRPKAAAARDVDELRAILEEMVGRLGQSHFGIMPRELAGAGDGPEPEDAPAHDHAPDDGGPTGDLGVQFRRVERTIATVAPTRDGPAERAGIRAGWELLAVDGRRVEVPTADLGPVERTLMMTPPKPGDAMRRFRAESTAAMAAATAAGSSVDLTLRDDAGAERHLRITAGDLGGEIVEFGNLPPLEARVDARLVGDAEWTAFGAAGQPRRIGLIAFNVWMLPTAAAIDAAVDRFRDCDAIILDLRGNPGGVGGLAMGVGGHFLGQADSLGRMTNRGGAIDFRVNPRRSTADGRRVEPFAGPLAILVDPLTASTSEIFAAGLQELGRATIVGETTAGAALPSVVRRLPNGDVLQMAVADFVTPKGNRIEGHGVVPDVPVHLTLDLLRRESDPTLAAAVRFLAERLADRSAAPAASSH